MLVTSFGPGIKLHMFDAPWCAVVCPWGALVCLDVLWCALMCPDFSLCVWWTSSGHFLSRLSSSSTSLHHQGPSMSEG